VTDSEARDEKSLWVKIIGPCYTETSIARALGWTPEQVTEAVGTLSLLEVETVDGARLYPAFQVVDGRIVDRIGDILRVLSAGTQSRWTWAQWLNSPVDDETGEPAPTAIDQLRAGRFDDVLRDAQHAAAAWSR